MDKFPRVTVTQLINTVNASNKNKNNGQSKKGDEDLQVGGHLVMRAGRFGESNEIVHRESDEYNQRAYLKAQASEGDVDTILIPSRGIC